MKKRIFLNIQCLFFYFSRHILKAAHQPFNIDQKQVNAVAARIEFDLRIGSAFTRFQTLSLQNFEPLAKEIVSYGLLY